MEKRSTPSLQITDRFGAQTAYASLRLPPKPPYRQSTPPLSM